MPYWTRIIICVISVISHVDNEKSTLTDSRVTDVGIIAEEVGGDVRMTDTGEDEKKKKKKTPESSPCEVPQENPEASIFEGTDFFYSEYKSFVVSLWSTICGKLSTVPAENISSFNESVEPHIQLMRKDGVDLSALERRVDDFFKKALDCDQISEAISHETQTKMLLKRLKKNTLNPKRFYLIIKEPWHILIGKKLSWRAQ